MSAKKSIFLVDRVGVGQEVEEEEATEKKSGQPGMTARNRVYA